MFPFMFSTRFNPPNKVDLGHELLLALLVLTMTAGRIVREEAGPSDLWCVVLFLVLYHPMDPSSQYLLAKLSIGRLLEL